MQVSVEKLDNPLEHNLTISIPSDWIDSEVDKEVQEYAKDAKMPGFRPGKIPFKVMVQRYGKPLSAEIIKDRMPVWIQDAFDAKKLDVAGFTSFRLTPHERGTDFEFSVTIEAMPEISDSFYENLPVVVTESELTEEQIRKSLRKIAVERAEYVEAEVSSGRDQRITLQYRLADLTDKAFTAEMFYYSGLNSNMKEFDKVLEGVRAGDRIEIEFDPFSLRTGVAPKDELKRNLLVLIHKVERFGKEPQIDDALAEKLGIKEGGVEQLKKEVTQELERHLKKNIENLNRTSIKNALYERCQRTDEITIPRCMYLDSGLALGPYPILDEEILPNIDEDEIENRKRDTLFTLITHHIYDEHYNSTLDDKELEEFVYEDAQGYDNPDEYVKHALSDRNTAYFLQSAFKQKKAVEKIMETADYTTKHVDADESMP
ncbi:MAG: trigger factor [Gammaproteobacteria bacterium]|nr:trigger factor [Gammaproteobacteria bacterium]MCY4227258.1 trigger factor [Gammaproteobacteria bacterium]